MRITCKTPSTGRPINFTAAGLGQEWQTIAEAPDFSVPDTSNVFPDRDPTDEGRAIRPGEIFFLTPLYVRNTSEDACWVEARLLLEDDTAIACPGRIDILPGDTAVVAVQGRSLVKRDAAGLSGDRLQLRAQAADVLDAWGSGEEKPSAEHIGVVQA